MSSIAKRLAMVISIPSFIQTNKRFAAWLWVFMAICCRSLAFIFAKKAALVSIDGGLLQIVFNTWYVAEVIVLMLQAIFWVNALRKLALNLAYPFLSLVFFFNLIAAWAIFKETIETNNIVGICLIVIGLIVTSTGNRWESQS